MPKAPKRTGRVNSVIPGWPGPTQPPPLCQNRPRRGGSLNTATVQEHPGHGRWKRKYKSLAGWLKAHPGEVVGRLLTPVPEMVYFNYYCRRRYRCIYTWQPASAPLPPGAKVFPNYEAWEEAYRRGCA